MMIALITIASYLIGSIPAAYMITKRATGKDLRNEGSGNIGSRNAFEVTNSKKVGVVVLVFDIVKGILPLVLLWVFDYPTLIPLAAIAIILGHCFPLWLRFHGGKALATSAGIMLLCQPFALILWLQTYVLLSMTRKNIHLNAALSTICSGILISVLPSNVFYNPLNISPDTIHYVFSLRMSLVIIHSFILLRHISPIYSILRAKQQ